MLKDNRKTCFDIFKALAIILVIVGHINFASNVIGLKKYIYAFHMPLFFFIYGIISSVKQEYNFSLKVINVKIKKIIIPYLIWALIFSEFSPINLIYILYGSHQSLILCSNSSLWFLPCYFFSSLLFDFILSNKSRIKNDKIFLTIIALVSLLLASKFNISFELGVPLCINASFMGIFFMIIGYLTYPIIDNLQHHSLKSIILLFICFFITLLFRYNNIDYVLMAENTYGNIINFLIVSMSGCFLILIISLLLDKVKEDFKIKKYLCFLGMNTFVVFVVHKSIIAFMDIAFSKINISIYPLFILALTLVVVIIISTIAILLINEYAPILNGKIQNKK